MSQADEVFFREWDARRPGERRSLDRARALLARAGLAEPPAEVLTVVGSKGKGTAAVYASAYLCAAGHRVVTVTSPSLLRTSERIRVDGEEIDEATLAGLGERLGARLTGLPPRTPGAGYLSPSGLFMLAGLLHAGAVGADYAVLEAGRGGRSDEVSLVAPAVVAVTPIFDEHLDLLGGSLAAVVEDKCGVIAAATRAVVVGPQPGATGGLIHDRVAARSGGRLAAIDVTGEAAGVPGQLLPPEHVLPPGLGRGNARLGCAAAARLLAAPPDRSVLEQVLGSVSLPGRLSVHPLPGTGTELLIDSAVNRTGFSAAAGYAAARPGRVDHVLLSLPDDKDLPGAVEQFRDGTSVTFVTVTASHLRFTRPLPAAWTRVPAAEVDRAYLARLGRRILALGTVSFVAHLLRLVGADTAVAFRPPSTPPVT